MRQLLVASCSAARPAVDALETWFQAAPHALAELARHPVHLDLDRAPPLTRARAFFGFGWQGRAQVRRVETRLDAPIAAVIEACACGHHHLMGLGRVGPPALRWTATAGWIDRLALREGAGLVWMTATRRPRWAAGPDGVLEPRMFEDAADQDRVTDVLTRRLLPAGGTALDLSEG